MYYIGIDLGTSAMKLMLVTESGEIVNSITKEYPLYFPHSGWSEQKPSDWWSACVEGIGELLKGYDANKVAGIGLGGQETRRRTLQNEHQDLQSRRDRAQMAKELGRRPCL